MSAERKLPFRERSIAYQFYQHTGGQDRPQAQLMQELDWDRRMVNSARRLLRKRNLLLPLSEEDARIEKERKAVENAARIAKSNQNRPKTMADILLEYTAGKDRPREELEAGLGWRVDQVKYAREQLKKEGKLSPLTPEEAALEERQKRDKISRGRGGILPDIRFFVALNFPPTLVIDAFFLESGRKLDYIAVSNASRSIDRSGGLQLSLADKRRYAREWSEEERYDFIRPWVELKLLSGGIVDPKEALVQHPELPILENVVNPKVIRIIKGADLAAIPASVQDWITLGEFLEAKEKSLNDKPEKYRKFVERINDLPEYLTPCFRAITEHLVNHKTG